MDNNLVLLHLSLIENMGPALLERIERRLSADMVLADLYQLTTQDMCHLFALSQGQAQIIVDGLQSTAVLEKELALIANYAINWCTRHDERYPTLLREIHLPPLVLYWQGRDLAGMAESVAFVGSRKAEAYTQRVINRLVAPLVEYGFSIVSGGARGADTMAHKATLDAGGTTVAVLGSGLLEPYPSQNIKLFETIAQTGAVVSAFPLTMEGLPGNFPARNRIIAGLSRGTVVVAAARKSGALITARYALDQGREVFAVPGHIDDELSLGCHDLIKQGAVLVSEVADIVREFGFDVDLAPEVTPVKNGDKAAQGSILSHSSEEKLSEHPILRYCKEPCSMEDLLGTAGMEYSQLVQHLFDLQIEGRVEQTAAGLWQALF